MTGANPHLVGYGPSWQYNVVPLLSKTGGKAHLSPFIALFLLWAAAIHGQEPLVFASADTAPYTTEDESGYYNQLLAEVGERIGRPVQIRRLPSERSLLEAAMGRVDGEFGRIAGIEEQYPTLRRVPTPLTNWKFVAFSTDPEQPGIESFAELGDFRVAYINGWKIFEQNVGDTENTMLVQGENQLFRVLLSGRVDLALYSAVRGNRWIRENAPGRVHRVPGSLAERPMYLFLHEQEAALVPIIAEALAEIRQEPWFVELQLTTLGVGE